MEKLHAAEREAHFQVKMLKDSRPPNSLGCWDAEGLHDAVAGSNSTRQNVQNTAFSDNF